MSPRGRRPHIPRSERSIPCDKFGACFATTPSPDTEPLFRCNDAPPYTDSAELPPEAICTRRIEEAVIHETDPYKRSYIEQCIALDSMMANTQLNPYLLNDRFQSIESHLGRIIHTGEIDTVDRLTTHINARLLEASLRIYFHRAMQPEEPLDKELMVEAHRKYVDVLADFYDGPYADFGPELALKRTEIEVMVLLSRKLNARNFPYASVFRETSSSSRAFNHASSTYTPEHGKTLIQVETSDYTNGNGYSHKRPHSILVIHNNLVNPDFRDGELIIQKIAPSIPAEEPIDEIPFEQFEAYDPNVGVRWYAVDVRSTPQAADEAFEFVQYVGGHKRDGLIASIVKESRGEQLSLDELNLINIASHYLIAALNQTRS